MRRIFVEAKTKHAVKDTLDKARALGRVSGRDTEVELRFLVLVGS